MRPEAPWEGLQLLNVDFSLTQYEEDARHPVYELGAANVVTSLVPGAGAFLGEDVHRPVLDVDMPVTVVPSSTPGHCHLYIDREMPWSTYARLLDALAEAGIVEGGYVAASHARGHTAVRLPWVRKAA